MVSFYDVLCIYISYFLNCEMFVTQSGIECALCQQSIVHLQIQRLSVHVPDYRYTPHRDVQNLATSSSDVHSYLSVR